eukprot:g14039.t1
MDESISARRAWTGDTVGESPEKRARVGGIYVGTLYAPTEDIVVGEEDVEMVQYDSDGEENKPMTPEEIAEGDEAEFDKMDKYETYDPVERQPGMRVLDATWVRRRKPDGSIRCRYCVREFKRGDPRRDVFAVASSTSTSRVIDVIGVKMGYGFMTADAENTFWQVPISEEAYMEAPKEWIARQEARGIEIPNNVVWKLKKEWYGHRIAGQTFVEWTAGHLGEIGFGRNPAAPGLDVAGFGQIGSYLPVVGCIQLGSSFLLQSLSRLDFAASVSSYVHLGSTILIRSLSYPGSSLSWHWT